MKKTFSIITILLLFLHFCEAQDTLFVKNNNFYIQTKYHYGFIMPHHKSIEYLLEDHIHVYEITLSKPTYGAKLWEQLYRYPEVGIGFCHGNLGNDKFYGKSNALFSFINIPVISTQHFKFNYKIALGLSYLNKTFDIDNNYLNIAIGSHVNVYFNYGLNTQCQLCRHLYWVSEIGITHFSNGKIKSPNLGLNHFTFSSGIRYFAENIPIQRIKQRIPEFKGKNEFSVFSAVGRKMVSRYDAGNFLISSLSVNYERLVSHKRRLGAGIDLFYDGSIKKEFEIIGKTDKKAIDFTKVGLHISHDLLIDRISLSLQLGTYIYSEWKKGGPVYQRYGLKYNFTKKFMGIIALKSHLGNADFIEWGIGYKWN